MTAIIAVCLLMAVPWRWSLPGTAALIAGQAPLAVAFPAANWPDAPAARQRRLSRAARASAGALAAGVEGRAQLADGLDVAFDPDADSHRA
jgi:hypothetical protein